MKKYILTVLFVSATLISAFAQAGEENTPALIKSKNFTFYATSATPQYNAEIARVLRSIPGSTGAMVSLSPTQSQLEIKKDTISVYLPYFGRSHGIILPMDRDNQGIRFTSTDFKYKEVKGRKGRQTITMIIEDNPERPRMMLDISASGYATLSINLNSRSPISYSGYVDKTDPPKKKKD